MAKFDWQQSLVFYKQGANCYMLEKQRANTLSRFIGIQFQLLNAGRTAGKRMSDCVNIRNYGAPWQHLAKNILHEHNKNIITRGNEINNLVPHDMNLVCSN